eukprot:CAMPEP_0173450280 /NCGR_PEP_ID=MMETSP1357-20121228/44414_1 /TAXON_ID=77926 /ORGANISM="Hemiselmis rufescens, Strain PCC563" /LENGTH=128 /DNA_ID=CAMNT_0014416939 /DNA_START=57 /DNA_END=440 /DNA_ORIENTATION=+
MASLPAEGGKLQRVKTPKIRKVKEKQKPAEKEDPKKKEEKGLKDVAKDAIQEESKGLSRDVIIPPEDLRIMKEEKAAGRPPAALDEGLSVRLERVWEQLEMPMMEKLGMVVKYSELQNAVLLEESISC